MSRVHSRGASIQVVPSAFVSRSEFKVRLVEKRERMFTSEFVSSQQGQLHRISTHATEALASSLSHKQARATRTNARTLTRFRAYFLHMKQIF